MKKRFYDVFDINKAYRSMFFILFTLSFLYGGSTAVLAQEPNQWSADQRIPGYQTGTFTPYVIADKYGVVHAFASEKFGGELSPTAVVYRQWTLAKGWTSPTEVLELPYGYGDAQIHGAFIDSNDMIHVVFWGGDPVTAYMFYSSAPLASIESISAWSLPVLLGGDAFYPSSASIAGDSEGNLIVIYNGKKDLNGIYMVHSPDSGSTWSTPEPMFLTYEAEHVPLALNLHVAQTGEIFAIWNVVNYVGVDLFVYFSKYDPVNNKWGKLVLLDKRPAGDSFGPSFPSVADNGKDIVVMYNNGNIFPNRSVFLGAPVQTFRMSNDGGQSWSTPLVPFIEHLGRSGEHTLATDGAGNIHAMFVQRIDELSPSNEYAPLYGIWHSILKDGAWGSLDRMVTTVQPHDLRSVVSQGNVLMMIWREDPGLGQSGIWFTYTILDVPGEPIVPLKRDTLSNIPPLSSTEEAVTPPALPSFENDVTVNTFFLPDFVKQPAGALMFSVMVVIATLVIVVVLYRFTRKR